jgi:hypothetical protein
MKFRNYIAGAMVLSLLTVAAVHPASYCRVVSSAKSVGCVLRDMRSADRSMNFVERVLFSLALADSSAPPAKQ